MKRLLNKKLKEKYLERKLEVNYNENALIIIVKIFLSF